MKTQGLGPRIVRRTGLVTGIALLTCAGLPQATAQDFQPSRPSRSRSDHDLGRGGTQNNGPVKDQAADPKADRDAQMRAAELARNGTSVSADTGQGGEAAQTGEDGSRVGSLIDQEGDISIDFAGPVELSAFLDYVSRALGLTMRTVTIPSATVTFYAPVRIPVTQLLPLTQSILEDNGLTMIRDEESGTYVVSQIGEVKVGAETTRIFPTPLLSPQAMMTAIAAQLGSNVGSSGARMTPLDDIGVLIVTASPRTLQTIQKLIDDITKSINAQGLHAFDIQEVSATYARDRIITLIGDAMAGGPGAIQRPQGAQGVGGVSGSFSNIGSRLFVDLGNRLVLRGTQEEADMLTKHVELVDVISTLNVKRYLIGNAAAQVARSGSELGLGSVTEISAGATQSGGFGARRPGFGGQEETSVQPSASQFVLDTETGSFIYYGTESQHERVSAIVDEFKKTDLGDTIEIRIHKLRYASVEPPEGVEGDGVVAILQALITEPGQRTTSSPFLPGSRGGGVAGGITAADIAAFAQQNPDGGADLESAVADINAGSNASSGAAQGAGAGGTRLIATTDNTTIVADQVRNQIIIKAPQKAQDQFERIIKQLDTRQAQVYLEIQIVSVLAMDEFDFAADVQLNAGQFSFLSSFGLTATPAGGDQFTPRTVGLGNAGATSTIINSDFLPLAINALQSIGETRTLSVPQLLVNDNQLATYTSTSEVPYAATVTGTSTTTTSQGGVAEAGTIISVTPRIGSGGYVNMSQLSIELSSFTAAPSSNLQPPSQVDAIETDVTLPSDSTIVVGGFRLNIDQDEERSIPILGDIPLIGLLFKDIGKSHTNTTVFFFITPRIINDTRSSDMKLITDGPMREMGVEGDVPDLEFVSVPLRGRVSREIETNDAPFEDAE